MKKAHFEIGVLDFADEVRSAACIGLITNAFAKSERYKVDRLIDEFQTIEAPFYRMFFIATVNDEVVGVAGLKSADWASHTHIFYHSAVETKFRGQGIGRALIQARLDWLTTHFPSGRALVSSAKLKRYNTLGFKTLRITNVDGRCLLQYKWQ